MCKIKDRFFHLSEQDLLLILSTTVVGIMATIDSLSAKRELQRKLKHNRWGEANSTLDWCSQLGYVPYEFTLQLTFGLKLSVPFQVVASCKRKPVNTCNLVVVLASSTHRTCRGCTSGPSLRVPD